jgi:TonB family protein
MKIVSGRRSAVSFLFVLAFGVLSASAQSKAAFIAPEKNPTSEIVVEKLEENFAAHFKIIDDSLAETVFRSQNLETPFNLTLDQAQNLGKAIGCDFYFLIKAETIARTSFEKENYKESYAAVFGVSARTGKLIFWELFKAEAERAEVAEKKLLSALDEFSGAAITKIQSAFGKELNEKAPPKLAEPPAENSPEAKNFRPPLPFRRVKPEYTRLANLYSVAATVDVSVDVDADGKVLRTQIVRWAGYGLDESVAETIRRMNWRAAEKDGKTLPIRVLLRYNFRKIERDE